MALVALKLDDLGKAWRDHGVDSPVVPLRNSGNSQCLHCLQLHQGLLNQLVQLRALKGTDAVGSVAGLLATVHTAARKGNLKEMSSRQQGGKLTEDVDCFELVDALCGALHEEFMEVFQRAIPELPEAASYWASMMSTVQHTRQVCHTTKKDCGHKGDPVNQQYRAVSVRYAALLHGGGMDQLLCSVLGHYLAAKTECKDCAKKRKDGMRPAVKSVTEQLQCWPVMLLVSVQSQQSQSAGNDINAAVSLQLQQRVELEEWSSHDWSRHMVSFTLKTIVFREGGITDGHFFVALQRAPNRWVVFNSASTSGPHTLEQIQQRFGGKVYGVVYMRTERPAEDDRQSLAEWLDDPAHADAVRMLASADVTNGVEAPPAAPAPAPSTTSEQSPATSSPDSSLPLMWDVAPSPGPQSLVIPSGPSCPAAASIKPSSGQSATQTTKASRQDKRNTANGAVAAVSSSAVQFDLAGLLSRAMTTAQHKQSKKQRSPVSKGNDAGGKLQAATDLSASPTAAAQTARKPMIGQAVDPDQEAAILEKARQLRAERQAEQALIKAISGSSAAAAAHGCASQLAVDKKAAKQMAAQKRAERLALKQAESRAKKAAVMQQAAADAEVAPVGADQLAPVAEAADETAAEAASIDQGAGGDAVQETAAQPTCNADKGPASADTVAANVAPAADNEADREPTAAKGAFEDVPSSTVLAANNTAVQDAAVQVAADAIVAQEGIAEVTDSMVAIAATADQTAAEAAAADKEGSEVAVADSTAAEAALGDSLAGEAASAVEPAERGQAAAQEAAGNAAADEKEADDAVTRAASQNMPPAAAGQEKAAAPESSLSAGAVTTAPVLKMAAAESSGGKAAADKAAAQTPAEPANTVEQAVAAEIATPELTAGQQTAVQDANADIEVREPMSAGSVAAGRTANATADEKMSAADETASTGDVQQSIDVPPAVQKAAQPAQKAARPAQKAARPAQKAARLAQKAARPAQKAAQPAQKAAQLAQEAARPAQEAAQPAQEAAQTVREAGQAGFSQSAGSVTPTKPTASSQKLQAISTSFEADKSPPQDGDESEPDRGLISTRWSQDAVAVTQAGLPDVEAHIAGDGSTDLPSCGGDASVVQTKLLHRADSSDALVPTQPASAGRLLSDELEAVPGEGHTSLPNSHRDGSVVRADLLQRTGMIGEDQGINMLCMDRAAGQLPQPNGDRSASGNAQAQGGLLIGMSRADSPEGPVPAQPASAGSPLSDELETVDGQGHSEVPSGAHVQQQGQPTAAVPTVNKTTAQQPALEPSVQGLHPAAPAADQSRTSTLPRGPVQPTDASLVDGQGGGSASAQPAQEQEQPAAASADSQGKGQVLDLVPVVQEPAAVSSHQLGNEALVNNAAKVEAAHLSRPAGSVQSSDAVGAGGSVAIAAAAEAETGGSNLHQGTAESEGGVPTQSAVHLPSCGRGGSVVQADLLQRTGMIGEDQGINVPCLDRAAELLPQPKGDRPASGDPQEQAGIVVSMSRADSCDAPVPAQSASAGLLLSDELETVDGQGHSEVPSGGHVQQQGEPPAAVPTVSQATAQQPALEPSVQGQAPAALADVQSRTSTLPLGPVQPTAASPVDGQGGASASAVLQRQTQHSAAGQLHHSLPPPALGPGQGQLAAALTDDHTEGQLIAAIPAQPVQEQEQPAAASADSQGKGQVLDMLPVQEPAADSSHQLGNVVSNAAKVEAAHSLQAAGSVRGSHATKAGGSVAAAEAETGGSNLHRGTAGSMAGAPPQSAALASGHSSAPEAAQAAAAISSALEAALHKASRRDAKPHASPAASKGELPAPAGAQAQGEATAGGDTAAAAAHAQDTAAESAANAVGGVAPQAADGQGTGLHVAAEAAAHAAQGFVAQPAPVEVVGAGIDPLVPPHTMQAADEAAEPAPPPLPPTPPPPALPLQASAAQAHVGAPDADPASASAAAKPAAMRAYHLAADCTTAVGTLATAADALMAHAPDSAAPGGDAHPIAAAIVVEHPPAPIAQTASASKGWRPKVGQVLTVTVVLPSLVALHVPIGCWAASVVGVAACRKVLRAWQ